MQYGFMKAAAAAMLVSALGVVITSAETRAQSYEEILAAAKEEGRLVIGDSASEAAFRPIVEAFNEAFPEIEAEHFSIGGNDIIVRMEQEIQAGTPTSVDVFAAGETPALGLAGDGKLMSVDWAALGIPDKLVRNEYQVSATAVITVLGYNTNLITREELPKTWDDLLDPKWQGKLVMPVSGWGSVAADLAEAWGEEKAIDFTKKITEVATTVASTPEVAPRVGSGEFTIGIMRIHHAKGQMKRGAPLDFIVLDPVPSPLLTWQIPVGAPHPNAAKVFMKWVLSQEGHKHYEEAAERGNPYVDGSETAEIIGDLNLAIYDPNTGDLEHRLQLERQLQELVLPR